MSGTHVIAIGFRVYSRFYAVNVFCYSLVRFLSVLVKVRGRTRYVLVLLLGTKACQILL